MIKKLPKEFLSVISSNNGLKQYLSNLSKGRDCTPRSWLYEDLEPRKILDNWLSVLSKLEHGSTFEKKVFQFDTSQEEKWGPQGCVAPINELLDGIVMPTFAGGNSPSPEAFNTSAWKKSINSVIRELNNSGVRALRPASYKSVVDNMRARDTLESNSGWPLFQRRNKPDVLSQAVAAAENGEWIEYPAIALFRNYNLKTRLVWMFPMSANMVEGSFFQPAQQSILRTANQFYAPWVGFESVRELITRAYSEGKVIAASDFSATDEHFQLPSSQQVFAVLERLFQKSYSKALYNSVEHMHTIPLVISSTEMIVGNHGVSSGSNWTNFIETVFDHIFSKYVSESTKYSGMYAIGDDMSWISNKWDDSFAEELEQLGEQVGQHIKAEKTTNEPDSVKSLQRLFQRGYNRPDGLVRGVYSTVRALKSSVYPEKFHKPSLWSSDMFCARQYMILENCVDHPLFEDFVKFVVKGQRDLIPFAQKKRAELDKITRETKLLPGFNPTYNQEKRDSSLASFASIAIAKTL